MQINIGLLKQQHMTIRATTDDLLALTDLQFDQGFPGVTNARLKLAKVIADHLATETVEIHEPLQARGKADDIPAYAEIVSRIRELRVMFSCHIAKWSLAAIRKDWAGYGRSLREIAVELADILDREERDLFPVAQTILTKVEPARRSNTLLFDPSLLSQSSSRRRLVSAVERYSENPWKPQPSLG